MQKRVLHPTIFLKDRKHDIDIHVFEPCSMLWEAGVPTFYSCQGGPDCKNDGIIVQRRAYVVVRRKDAKKACKVLKEFRPKIDDNLLYKRVAIRFRATEAAKNIPVIIEETKITHKLLKGA